MENRNLDVWAIQNNFEELNNALKNIKSNGNNILYTNVVCNFKIGDAEIKSKQFDTILYSEENDVLIMLMRGGKSTAEDIRQYLDNKDINYNEVVFQSFEDEYQDNQMIPEIWIVREQTVLTDAIEDSIKRGSKPIFDYYPNLIGNLDLNYLTNNDEAISIDGRIFKGYLQSEDKIILLVNQDDQRNMKPKDVHNLLKQSNFKCNVFLDEQPTIIEEQSFCKTKK